MSRLLALLSELLPCSDREAILGDICESELTPMEALFELTGLIVRRMLEPYSDWKVWLCLGLAPLISLLLVGLSVALTNKAGQFITNPETSATSLLEVLRLGGLFLAASTTFCVAGFGLGRRTPFALWIAILVPAVLCFAQYPATTLASCCVFLFLLPVLGARLMMKRLRSSRVWSVVATLLLLVLPGLAIVTDRGIQLNVALLLIPALYCLFSLTKGQRYAY